MKSQKRPIRLFKGFSEGKQGAVAIPLAFFRDLLPQIDDLAEIKLLLHIFYRMENQEGPFRYVTWTSLYDNPAFVSSLDRDQSVAWDLLADAVNSAVERGVLLKAEIETSGETETYLFLNSPKGRAALRALQSGQWRPAAVGELSVPAPRETPNIFRLYEENIGPLTPLLAETLGEAEDTYPADWIEDAVRIAVQNNKRTWRYVAAILDRWQREGRYGKQEKPQDRSDTPEARRKYVEGDYSEFIEH